MLRITTACKAFVLRHKDDSGFPAALLVWMENPFWYDLEEAELLIRPFCDASFLMQRNVNSMAHVMLILLNLYSHVCEFCGDSPEQEALLKDMEKRWKGQDQQLFFSSILPAPCLSRHSGTALANVFGGEW